jgi:hypothetical protein
MPINPADLYVLGIDEMASSYMLRWRSMVMVRPVMVRPYP